MCFLNIVSFLLKLSLFKLINLKKIFLKKFSDYLAIINPI